MNQEFLQAGWWLSSPSTLTQSNFSFDFQLWVSCGFAVLQKTDCNVSSHVPSALPSITVSGPTEPEAEDEHCCPDAAL